MKQSLIITILIVFSAASYAQDFSQSAGIRVGWSPGIEYRIFTDDANSYRALLATRDHGVQLHAFKEFHQYELFSFTDQLVFYYGAGIHAGFESWDEVKYNNNTRWFDTRTAFLAGVDGIAGLDYVFYEAPISVGIEVKPYFDVFGKKMFDLNLFDFALTLRYLF